MTQTLAVYSWHTHGKRTKSNGLSFLDREIANTANINERSNNTNVPVRVFSRPRRVRPADGKPTLEDVPSPKSAPRPRFCKRKLNTAHSTTNGRNNVGTHEPCE